MTTTGHASVPAGSSPAAVSNHRTIAVAIYFLYFAALACGFTLLLGVVLAYIRRGDARGTIWESHFDNQISVFWTTILVGLLGALLTVIGIGFLILLILFVWYLVRTIRGVLRAADGLPYR